MAWHVCKLGEGSDEKLSYDCLQIGEAEEQERMIVLILKFR